MARRYTVTSVRRVANAVIRLLVRLRLAGRHTYVLTTRGRRSGRDVSTPVTLVEEAGARWLVAPYGVTSWVQNARAAGSVQLRRGGSRETVSVVELAAEESSLVLRKYVRRVRVVRPFFDAGPDSPVSAFLAEAGRHPVFRLADPEKASARTMASVRATTGVPADGDGRGARLAGIVACAQQAARDFLAARAVRR
jgi:deazaflavin-dependent oxidoreductase (nitroreductase family)